MLFSKSSFAVRHAASKDAERYNLNGVHILPDGSTVATDGHRLMRAHVVVPPLTDFPGFENEESDRKKRKKGKAKLKPFTLAIDAVDRLIAAIPKKNPKPICAHAALDVKKTNSGELARFVTTDLKCTQEIQGEKIDNFPDWKQVFPKDEEFTHSVAFDINYVADFAKACREFGMPRPMAVTLELTKDPMKPMKFTFKNPDVGTLEMILMPMRIG